MLQLFRRQAGVSRFMSFPGVNFSKKNDKIKPLAKAKTAAWEKPSGASLS
jgi:hypothetical protein